MIYLTLVGIVLLGALASLLFGWFWYSGKAFGPIWMKEMGMAKPDISGGALKKMMIKMLACGFGAELLKSFCLLFLSVGLGINQFFLAFVLWLGFMVPILLNTVIYEKRSWKLFMIHGGYQLLSLFVIDLVFFLI